LSGHGKVRGKCSFGKVRENEKLVPPIGESDFQAKMHQIRASAPDPAAGAYSTPPDPLAALNIAP